MRPRGMLYRPCSPIHPNMNATAPPPLATFPSAAASAAVPARTNSMAVLSLVFGILSWSLLPVVAGVVAIITGHMARRQLKQPSFDGESGDGLAVAGLILGYLSVLLALFAGLMVLLIMAGVFGLMAWQL